jgi:hypothetical protein
MGPESFLGKRAQTLALMMLILQDGAFNTLKNAIPGESTDPGQLDEWALLLGLSDGEGGYGRKKATAAAGGVGEVTGVKGAFVPDAEELTAEDGVTVFAVSGITTVSGSPPGKGVVTATIYAVTTGTAGNLPAGSVLTFTSAPTDIDSTITLSSPLSDGLNVEDNLALLKRIYARLQQPPKGGVASDYRDWAEAASSLIKRAYPYPLRGGLGAPHVAILGYGSGTARTSTVAGIDSTVDDYINGDAGEEGTRPVTTQGYDTIIPTIAGAELVIRTRLTPWSDKYSFDWTDTAATYAVDTWTNTAGSAATLELDQLAPASLKASIDAGLRPRLQVQSTTSGASAINPQVRVVSYTDNGGITTTLTLENPLPEGFTAPTAADIVYAGGPMVDAIATSQLAYVDSLGPSRDSGYAPDSDQWEDTCAIARLTQIALQEKDADGTPFASNLAIAAGVTIGKGGAAVAAADAAATDTGTPQILYAQLVAVTQ